MGTGDASLEVHSMAARMAFRVESPMVHVLAPALPYACCNCDGEDGGVTICCSVVY